MPTGDEEQVTMRVLMKVQIDTEKANQAITDMTLPQVHTSVFERIKPEAAYIGTEDSMRTAFVVFDLKEPSDIPSIAEPFFQKLGAKLSLVPVMSFEDVQVGMQKYASG